MENVNMNQMPPIVGAPKKSLTPMILVVLLLAVIIIGGLYLIKSRSNTEPFVPNQTDSVTESLNRQNTSDDLNTIEADLNAETFNNLDQGAAVIEAELQ